MRLGARYASLTPCLYTLIRSWPILLLWVFGSACAHAQAVEIRHQGRDYLDIATVGAHFGLQATRLLDGDGVRLSSPWTRIDAGKEKKILYINQMPVYLGFPRVVVDARPYLSAADYQHVLQPILAPQLFPNPPKLKRIVIDPGHGGVDRGAENKAYGLWEKSLNLDVALRLKAILIGRGYEVILTREQDVYIPLEQRHQFANERGADLFISIHFNAAENEAAQGFETFALTPQYQSSSSSTRPSSEDYTKFPGNHQDAWNTLLAYHIQRGLVGRVSGSNRGLKRARFEVLKHLKCPGVLVEMGFVTNRVTAESLRRPESRQRLAEALAEGLAGYHQRLLRLP